MYSGYFQNLATHTKPDVSLPIFVTLLYKSYSLRNKYLKTGLVVSVFGKCEDWDRKLILKEPWLIDTTRF